MVLTDEMIVILFGLLQAVFVDNFNDSGRIWVSTNEGKTYTHYLVPFSVSKIEFHPDRSDWMLGYDRGTQKVSICTFYSFVGDSRIVFFSVTV